MEYCICLLFMTLVILYPMELQIIYSPYYMSLVTSAKCLLLSLDLLVIHIRETSYVTIMLSSYWDFYRVFSEL